jgi:hypothetical protein
VADDFLGIPGTAPNDIILLPQRNRKLFDKETLDICEIARTYPVQGPAYIPLRKGTTLLAGLNWPYEIYEWKGSWNP